MEPFSVRTTLTLADWRAYQKICAVRLQESQPTVIGISGIAAIAVVSFGVFWAFDALDLELSLPSAFLGVAFAVATIVLLRRQAMQSADPDPGGAFFRPCTYEFNAGGMEIVQSGLRVRCLWSHITAITASAEYIFLWVDRLAAHIVPVRHIPEGMTGNDALARLQAWVATAEEQPYELPIAEISDGAPEFTQSGTAPVTATKPWSRSVLRLLTLRSVDAASIPAKSSAIVWSSLLLSLTLWVAFDWLRNAPDPQFFPYEAPSLAWFVLAWLLTAAAMAKRSHPEIALHRTCTLLAIVIPVLLVLDFAIERFVSERWVGVAVWGLAIYALAYCERGLRSLAGSGQPAALMAGALVACIFLWLGSSWYIRPTLWIEGDASEDSDSTGWNASESILFEQPTRIDAAMGNISRPPGAAPVGFFVGFAGYGEQRVFAEEIKFAAQVFGQRYDTAARTLLLINDRRTVDQQPLASVSGLRYALKGIASRMELDRDILFLALSSHGSEDPLLSVSNGSIPLLNLTGERLAEALSESGIKWKVVVISACHAGAFIEPLRDPHTIVITAAAPERTSFGCSDERDLTYFGEAFFRDSLPNAASLRAAFDAAKVLIAEREQQEGVEASDPQAFFGEAMERQLSAVGERTITTLRE